MFLLLAWKLKTEKLHRIHVSFFYFFFILGRKGLQLLTMWYQVYLQKWPDKTHQIKSMSQKDHNSRGWNHYQKTFKNIWSLQNQIGAAKPKQQLQKQHQQLSCCRYYDIFISAFGFVLCCFCCSCCFFKSNNTSAASSSSNNLQWQADTIAYYHHIVNGTQDFRFRCHHP